MSTPSIARFFKLRAQSPFDRLALPDVAAIFDRMSERDFPPGSQVLAAGRPVDELLVIVGGSAQRTDGSAAMGVLGWAGVLLGVRPDQDVRAGEAGAQALVLGREHVFTAIEACPELLAAVVEQADDEAHR